MIPSPKAILVIRSLSSTLLCLALLGCERGAALSDEADSAPPSSGHVHQVADAAASGEAFDTIRDPVSGVVARFQGSEREPRLLPLRPMTADSEVLYGDPAVTGEPFVIRIRELPGLIVPPHSHPVDEHLTVVQGTWYFGIGDEYDPAQLRPLPPGSYAFVPAGTTMFAHSPEPAIVQVHGVGPFDVEWKHGLVTLDDADAAALFRFRAGDAIRTAPGAGRIRWGGASGTLIQYEVETADGNVFVVQEHEIQ